jgi:hypothetical protein
VHIDSDSAFSTAGKNSWTAGRTSFDATRRSALNAAGIILRDTGAHRNSRERSGELRHEHVSLGIRVRPKRYEYLICLRKINPSLAKLDPCDHAMFPPEDYG